MSHSEFDEGPWYKQFWLWFMIIPLSILIMGSFYLLYVSIVTNDGVVVDNYYRDGKGYILRKEEDAFARANRLTAVTKFSDQVISVQLDGTLSPLPETLELLIIFPTAQQFDQSVILTHRGLGSYTGSVTEATSGRRFLQLHPLESEVEWRLHAETTFPIQSENLILLPKQE